MVVIVPKKLPLKHSLMLRATLYHHHRPHAHHQADFCSLHRLFVSLVSTTKILPYVPTKKIECKSPFRKKSVNHKIWLSRHVLQQTILTYEKSNSWNILRYRVFNPTRSSTQWLAGDAGRSPEKKMKRGPPWPHWIPVETFCIWGAEECPPNLTWSSTRLRRSVLLLNFIFFH